jgi:hypothetical protein
MQHLVVLVRVLVVLSAARSISGQSGGCTMLQARGTLWRRAQRQRCRRSRAPTAMASGRCADYVGALLHDINLSSAYLR